MDGCGINVRIGIIYTSAVDENITADNQPLALFSAPYALILKVFDKFHDGI